MLRRQFLKRTAALAATAVIEPALSAAPASVPIIDTHIHIFDPSRPGGVPWPDKTDTALFKPALPSRYAALAQPHLCVIGAIAIECSPWTVDNFWLQDVVDKNPIMLGYIGDLLPAEPSFAATLEWLHRSPLFLGIRYGNLWNRDLLSSVQKPESRHWIEIAGAGWARAGDSQPRPHAHPSMPRCQQRATRRKPSSPASPAA